MNFRYHLVISEGKINGYYLSAILLILWLCVQLYYFNAYSARIVPDSSFRYIPYATELAATGSLQGGHDDRYILYILFLAFFIKSGLGLEVAVLVQAAVSGLAALCLYKSVLQLTSGHRLSALLAAVLFILWKDVQYLNFYILTESIFASLILISFYLVVRVRRQRDYLLPFLTAALTTTLRPNGFIVLVAVFASFLYYNRELIIQYGRETVTTTVLLSLAFIYLIDQYLLTTFDILGTYMRGEVIFASSIYAVSPEGPLVMPSPKYSPISRIILFFVYNPWFSFKLFFSKLLLFLAYLKPYYSHLHNASILLIIYPLYIASIWHSIKRASPATFFVIVTFGLQALIVAATSEDWDSRFIIPLIPLVFMIGITGLHDYSNSSIKRKPRPIPQSPAAP